MTEEDISKANLYFEKMSWGFDPERSTGTKNMNTPPKFGDPVTIGHVTLPDGYTIICCGSRFKTVTNEFAEAHNEFRKLGYSSEESFFLAEEAVEIAAKVADVEEVAKEFIAAVFDDSLKDKEKVDFFDLADVLAIFSKLNPSRSVRVIYNQLKTFIVSGMWSKFSRDMQEQSKSAELTLKTWNLRKSYLGYSDYGARHIKLP